MSADPAQFHGNTARVSRAVFFFQRRRCLSPHAFTLVELLLVMSIVSLLALIAFPAYGFLRKKAAGAVCISNLRTIGTSLNLYLTDHNAVWPQAPFLDFDNEEQEA